LFIDLHGGIRFAGVDGLPPLASQYVVSLTPPVLSELRAPGATTVDPAQ
jgi:hypothetical protein